MSKRTERTELDPSTGASPSQARPTTSDAPVKTETTSPTGARSKKRGPAQEVTAPSPMSGPSSAAPTTTGADAPTMTASPMGPPPAKKSRTNTPWTPAEEQRLKTMRDAGNSWADIAKTFPSRTEGSVKKHWYKDMHYAEFAEDESQALLNAIKEYEANKWKEIGKKVGKPAKACEQYAKEHFGGKS